MMLFLKGSFDALPPQVKVKPSEKPIRAQISLQSAWGLHVIPLTARASGQAERADVAGRKNPVIDADLC